MNKTMFDILKETVEHFNINNRAVVKDEDGDECCVYSHRANGGCAVGRLLPANVAEEMTQHATACVGRNIKVLIEHFPNITPNFFDLLQLLHDNKQNWNSNGLSKKGKQSAIFLAICFGIDYKQIPCLQ